VREGASQDLLATAIVLDAVGGMKTYQECDEGHKDEDLLDFLVNNWPMIKASPPSKNATQPAYHLLQVGVMKIPFIYKRGKGGFSRIGFLAPVNNL